jgi:hypothetical protein
VNDGLDLDPLGSVSESAFAEIGQRLDTGDDPDLWRVALPFILSELIALTPAGIRSNLGAEVGRCSHWLRPHQARWPADGGFAAPLGYGTGGGWLSHRSLPRFDWTVVLRFADGVWEPAGRGSVRNAIRVSVPSRTRRHAQAAVHTLWMIRRENFTVPYGFRKSPSGWACTASGDKETRSAER